MPAFRVSGATGQAPTTAWFGAAVPDAGFTTLIPGYFNGAVNNVYFVADNKNADFISNYVPFNTNFAAGQPNALTITLGASVTAPDGTSTANHIVETTSNSFHAMSAITPDGALVAYRRLAVIAKAAERTRMFMAICSQPFQAGETGCRTVFDLAGGQIGVANTQYGSDTFWQPGATSIKALGSGWYLCLMDVLCSINIIGRWISVLIGPDAGSGTGALNISYVGDATKGINVWKTSLLPPRAWGLQNVVFFDDFTSLATLDVNNTKAPGFNWYMNVVDFPIFGAGYGINPTPAAALTISSSIITMNCVGFSGGLHMLISTLGHTSGSGSVGTTWQPPALFETRYAFDTLPFSGSNGMAWWESSLETLIELPFGGFPPGTIGPTYQEIDFNEIHTPAGGGHGILSIDGDGTVPLPTTNQDNIQQNRSGGAPIWISSVTYGVGSSLLPVSWNGVLYTSLDTSTGAQPDLNIGTHWAVVTPAAGLPTTANTLQPNFANQNTYHVLWLQDRSMYDPRDIGIFLGFFNGFFAYRTDTQQACYLGYGLSQDLPTPFAGGTTHTLFTAGDRQHIPMFFDCSNQVNTYVDWAKVTQ